MCKNCLKPFKAANGDEPDAFAALGYDAMYLMADAINRAGKADPEAIKDVWLPPRILQELPEP